MSSSRSTPVCSTARRGSPSCMAARKAKSARCSVGRLRGGPGGGGSPAGALTESARLRFVQLLSAGADSVNYAAVPGRLMLASNVGAYAQPMAEYVMAVTLALARRLPQRHAEMARGEFGMWKPVLTLNGAVCGILGFGGIGR